MPVRAPGVLVEKTVEECHVGHLGDVRVGKEPEVVDAAAVVVELVGDESEVSRVPMPMVWKKIGYSEDARAAASAAPSSSVLPSVRNAT